MLWTAEPGATVTPGAPTIDLGGRRYTWAETGQARYTAIGETGLPSAGTMRYHDYQSGGAARLSFEAYGEEGWRVARGDLIDPADLAIRPAVRGALRRTRRARGARHGMPGWLVVDTVWARS